MKKRIFLVRHGESIANLREVVAFPDTPLSEKGELQAEKIGRKLAKEKIEIAFCSDLHRAKQTLVVMKKGGLKIDPQGVYYLPLLRETNRAEFEGQPRDEYYMARTKRGMDPNDFRCKGGESENDVKKRAEKFFKDYLTQTRFQQILVVGHGHFLRWLAEILKNDRSGIFSVVEIGTAHNRAI